MLRDRTVSAVDVNQGTETQEKHVVVDLPLQLICCQSLLLVGVDILVLFLHLLKSSNQGREDSSKGAINLETLFSENYCTFYLFTEHFEETQGK